MSDIEKYAHVGIEKLSQVIYKMQFLTPQVYPFIEWENLPEQAKAGYRTQAGKLSELYHIIPRLESE